MLPLRSASDKHVEYAGSRPLRRVDRAADGAGDPVGDQEPDPEHAGQLVRVLAHHAVGRGTVVLADPLDQVPEPVRREQQMQLTGDSERIPRCGRLRPAAATDADGGERGGGVAIDRLEHLLGPEPGDELLRATRADVPHPAQICDQRLLVSRRQRPCLGHLHLQAVSAVIDPRSDHVGALSLFEMDQRADQNDVLAVGVERVENRPATRVAGESRPPDDHLLVEALAHAT